MSVFCKIIIRTSFDLLPVAISHDMNHLVDLAKIMAHPQPIKLVINRKVSQITENLR